jgi:23S rRNA (uracil1939-C5)-methyltransferase
VVLEVRPPILEAEIVDLAHDGRGVARVAGKAIFVAGALPGERARFKVLRRRPHFDEAQLVELSRVSGDRVEPGCGHFGVCGGCSLQHLSPHAQLIAKQGQLLEALARIGRVSPALVLDPVAGPVWAYRRRARLGVKYVRKMGRVVVGFREREKPYLAELSRCEILVSPLQTLPRELAALVQSLDLREQIPQVEVAAGDESLALVFRVMAAPNPADLDKLRRFGLLQRAQIFLQTGAIESIRPLDPPEQPQRYAIAGQEVEIQFGPNDFIQVNSQINARVIASAIECLELDPADHVLDLFCGLGNFTLCVAKRARQVTGVEGAQALLDMALRNARLNAIENVEFICADLFAPGQSAAWSQRRYDLVLLDPPRAGAREIVERMQYWGPRRVVYISCHPGSLARDAGILVQTQGFELAAVGVMDMFPHTTHVESIAVFRKST